MQKCPVIFLMLHRERAKWKHRYQPHLYIFSLLIFYLIFTWLKDLVYKLGIGSPVLVAHAAKVEIMQSKEHILQAKET